MRRGRSRQLCCSGAPPLACRTLRSTTTFRSHQYDAAAARLKDGYTKQGENGRDSLLYVLDLGLALHSGDKLDESTKYFLQANDLAVIKDYTSISKEGATLLTSDNIKDYKAEDFENVLINTYLAMNYAVLGKFRGRAGRSPPDEPEAVHDGFARQAQV